MAQFKRGILGGFSGKLGTVVGSVINGKSYMRALPETSNSKKSTDRQVQVRERFKSVKQLVNPFIPMLDVGFRNQAVGVKAQNVAFSLFYSNGAVGMPPLFEIDYSKIILSSGSLSEFSALSANLSGRTFILSWLDNSGIFDAKSTDEVCLTLFFKGQNKCLYSRGEATRSDTGLSVEIPYLIPPDEIHAYDFYASVETQAVSGTMYLGAYSLV